jgi:hypothetical protein
LLALEEQNASQELDGKSDISVAIARLSYIFRQLLRAQGGEDVDPPASPADEAAEREPWTAAKAADHALDREIELARLEKENEELRRMLGLLPATYHSSESSNYGSVAPYSEMRRTDSMYAQNQFQRPPGSSFSNYMRTGP